MPTAMDHDESTLLALDHYAAAAPRVTRAFARRGAVLEGLVVELHELDVIVVRYRSRGSDRMLGALPLAPDLEGAVAALSDRLQEKEIEAGDNTWPGCLPGHPHPPTPAVVNGRASWQCPRTGATVAPLG